MYTNIPYMVEGEIVSVQPSPMAQKKNVVRYLCLVDMPNGSRILVPNVIASTVIGGIDDYFQVRSRTSTDSGEEFQPDANDNNDNARIGDRVYISFIGGNISKPIIIAYAQHPDQTQEFEKPEDLRPQAVFKYLGMRFDFKDNGVMTITHYGAPEVKYVKAGGIELPDLSVPSLGGEENPIPPDKENKAIVPAAPEKRTMVEFHDTGGLQIRDSLNQLVDVNTAQGRIYIANNDVQAGPQIETNDTDSEYVLLDRAKELVLINARKTAQIYTFGDRKDVTEKDHSHVISGNEVITISGNKEDTISGSLTESITGDYKQTVSGNYTVDSKGEWVQNFVGAVKIDTKDAMTLTAATNITAKTAGTASLILDGATVALGAAGIELLKMVSDTQQALMDTLTAILAQTHGTAMGPSSPPINAADFAKLLGTVTGLKAQLDAITGSL